MLLTNIHILLMQFNFFFHFLVNPTHLFLRKKKLKHQIGGLSFLFSELGFLENESDFFKIEIKKTRPK